MKIYIETKKLSTKGGEKNENKHNEIFTHIAKSFINSRGWAQALPKWEDKRIWGNEVRYAHRIMPNCPLSVPESIAHSKTQIDVVHGKRLSVEQRCPEIQEMASHGSLTPEILRQWTIKYLSCIPLVAIQRTNKTAYIKRCEKRGIESYQKKQASRISNALDKLQKDFKYCYFYTTTYDIKRHGVDLLHSFRVVKEQSRIIQRNVRRLLKGEYINVYEFTKRGYAHSHLVIGTNEETANPERNKFIKGRLRSGSLYEILTRGLLSPVLEIKPLKKGKLQGYLQKYLSKGLALPDMRTVQPFCILHNESIKQIYGILIPYLTGLRQYSVSQYFKSGAGEAMYVDAQKLEKELKTIEWIVNHNAQDDMFWKDEYQRIKANLLNTLNKLTSHCRHHTFLLQITDFEIGKQADIGLKDFKESRGVVTLLQGAKQLNCRGCPIADLLDKINGVQRTFRKAVDTYRAQGMLGKSDDYDVWKRTFAKIG